jgi:hypothetical protein
MKIKNYYFVAVLAVSTPLVFAQEDKDFGDLVPENNFSITQKRSFLKDNTDISNYEVKTSPQKEEFIYKVNSVKAPRKVFQKASSKLTVERTEGKISRISSVVYGSTEDNKGAQTIQSSSLGVDGKINSLSNCQQGYKLGWFSFKKEKSDLECLTVNKEVCSYLEKSEINDELLEKVKNCSDILGRFSNHQEKLEELTKDDHRENLKAMEKLNGNLSKINNFYDMSPKSLEDLSHVVQGYKAASEQCNFLKEKSYLRESKLEEPKSRNESKTTDQ